MNFTWWCRQVSPEEGYLEKHDNGSYVITNLQQVPLPMKAFGLEDGGCFGVGDGKIFLILKEKKLMSFLIGTLEEPYRKLRLNTASFISENGVFEIILEMRKDTRVAQTSLQVTVSKIPPPVVQIK